MSIDSQAAGSNGLYLDFSASGKATLCGWIKVNGWAKTAYGFALGFIGGVDYGVCWLQQGTAEALMGWWQANSPAASGATSTLVSGTGEWRFLAIAIDGSSITYYAGTELDECTAETETASFDAGAVINRATLANDSYGTSLYASLRGARLWVGEALTAEQIEAERLASDFRAVHTTGLHSELLLDDYTDPGDAVSGSDWTVLGAFAEDASEPDPHAPETDAGEPLALLLAFAF